MQAPHQLPTRLNRRQHWHGNLRLTAGLLLLWLAVTFGVSYWARELSFNFFGWPFSFWMAAQGAPLVYALIVWRYAQRMEQLDLRYGLDEPDA
jgi:putative solute:sodium symporter small subunit